MRMRLAPFIALSLLLAACDGPPPEDAERSARLAELRAQVELPAVPPLDQLRMPERMPDGSFSVAGLLANREALLNSEVELTALLRDIYACPNEEGQRAGCLRPHLFISDTLRTPQRLLVVGYDTRYERQLSEGERYTFVGRYALTYPGHVSTEDGLLIVQEIRGENILPFDEWEEMEEMETAPPERQQRR